MVTRRRLSRDIQRDKLARREALEDALHAEIARTLGEGEPTVSNSTKSMAARVAAIIASQIAVHPQAGQRALKAIEEDIPDYATSFVAELFDVASKSVGRELKRFRPAAPRVAKESPLQLPDDWAGPVAGPTAIERYFGIPRSTLYRWQKFNEVVAIQSRKSRKPVFPLKQFVDGKPADGLASLIAIFDDQSRAWKWLVTNHPKFDEKPPLDFLLSGQVNHVLKTASQEIGLTPTTVDI